MQVILAAATLLFAQSLWPYPPQTNLPQGMTEHVNAIQLSDVAAAADKDGGGLSVQFVAPEAGVCKLYLDLGAAYQAHPLSEPIEVGDHEEVVINGELPSLAEMQANGDNTGQWAVYVGCIDTEADDLYTSQMYTAKVPQ